MDNKQIAVFVSEFQSKLNDLNVPDIQIIDDPTIGETFRDFGFIMDTGEVFKLKYGNDAFDKYEALTRIIDSVDDIEVLGSAIFSKWRYYNHWTGSSIREEGPMKWFNLAINRLLELL